jgi:tetratricopeptide (TPR) repeat protein/predicted Ser/Thr protein kinase
LIGKILGNRYRILREVGSGGMAWVYLAEDINEHQLVAVKILYPQYSEDISYIQRFNREAKLAGTLNNQHVVRVLDYGASRDVHYLVMEYVEGHDLRQTLDVRGPLSVDDTLELVDQVCAALEHAHSFGIVHRDIKPQNLMLTETGLLKVLDFGIARARTLPSLTQSGFVGSPYYIAPEQAMGDEVDIRADLYSTGIVTYELLSGRVPFDDKSPWAIISQHIANDPPDLTLPTGTLPQPVARFLKRSFAKRPDDRFQTPTAMRRAIAALREGRPLPEEMGTPPPLSTNMMAMADGLYNRASEALSNKEWQRAVDLLNQVINLAPNHLEAHQKLKEAGREARLAALYRAAERALEAGRWQETLDELNEVLSIDANYLQAAELRVRARSALERQEVYKRVHELYEKGKRHSEAGEWTQAMAAFSQVQQISPGYQHTEDMLAEASRHRQPNQFSQITKKIKLTQPTGAQLRWVLGTLVLVSLIVVVVVFAQNRGFSTRPDEDSLAQPYSQAVAAGEAGNLDQALILLEQILAVDPDYEDAAAIYQQQLQNATLAERLATARQALDDERWSDAITMLTQIQGTDTGFVAGEVTSLLCRGYLQRGQHRIAGVASTGDQATVLAAVADLETGQRICPPDQVDLAEARLSEAQTYLTALRSVGDPTAVIEWLRPLLDVSPGYAGGQALNLLYQAYLSRGDAYKKTSDFERALADYELALALAVADTSTARDRRAEVLTALEVRTPSLAPNQSPAGAASTAEAGATAAELTPTAIPLRFAAPVPVGPESESVFGGEFAVIELEWEPIGGLAADEYYDVTVMHFVGDEPRYWGAPLEETSWQVPIEAGFGVAGEDRFYWWVTVRKANTAPGGDELDLPLSPASEVQTFYWRR